MSDDTFRVDPLFDYPDYVGFPERDPDWPYQPTYDDGDPEARLEADDPQITLPRGDMPTHGTWENRVGIEDYSEALDLYYREAVDDPVGVLDENFPAWSPKTLQEWDAQVEAMRKDIEDRERDLAITQEEAKARRDELQRMAQKAEDIRYKLILELDEALEDEMGRAGQLVVDEREDREKAKLWRQEWFEAVKDYTFWKIGPLPFVHRVVPGKVVSIEGATCTVSSELDVDEDGNATQPSKGVQYGVKKPIVGETYPLHVPRYANPAIPPPPKWIKVFAESDYLYSMATVPEQGWCVVRTIWPIPVPKEGEPQVALEWEVVIEKLDTRCKLIGVDGDEGGVWIELPWIRIRRRYADYGFGEFETHAYSLTDPRIVHVDNSPESRAILGTKVRTTPQLVPRESVTTFPYKTYDIRTHDFHWTLSANVENWQHGPDAHPPIGGSHPPYLSCCDAEVVGGDGHHDHGPPDVSYMIPWEPNYLQWQETVAHTHWTAQTVNPDQGQPAPQYTLDVPVWEFWRYWDGWTKLTEVADVETVQQRTHYENANIPPGRNGGGAASTLTRLEWPPDNVVVNLLRCASQCSDDAVQWSVVSRTLNYDTWRKYDGPLRDPRIWLGGLGRALPMTKVDDPSRANGELRWDGYWHVDSALAKRSTRSVEWATRPSFSLPSNGTRMTALEGIGESTDDGKVRAWAWWQQGSGDTATEKVYFYNGATWAIPPGFPDRCSVFDQTWDMSDMLMRLGNNASTNFKQSSDFGDTWQTAIINFPDGWAGTISLYAFIVLVR